MTAAFDLHAELASGLRDAPSAWHFVRLFAARYAAPIVEGDGSGEDELLAAEARLGFALPRSLREAYALIGRRDDLTRCQDRLLTPDQIHIDDAGQVLVFRWECQHVTEWGIPLSAVSEPDPPVVFRLNLSRPAGPIWRPFLDRVSLARVEMVLSEWMLSGERFADNRELDDEAVVLLEKRFRRLPMPDYPLWAEPDGGPMRWFEGLGAMLREDSGIWLWARAGSADSIAAVRCALPGEWLEDQEALMDDE
ncbi:hypothetical protein [Actinoplanes aureus]|uniref:Knr4/Smi1-like domain-containing protein n=1 Tax=Actinoplanes aureus TaxID=2792083 RepID=A0A931CHA6_9ACTN|nr:hypothetical protein [Actinoplanes aureus]MBG0568609.1 hypothetical protein [Actinoplanes aureus]